MIQYKADNAKRSKVRIAIISKTTIIYKMCATVIDIRTIN